MGNDNQILTETSNNLLLSTHMWSGRIRMPCVHPYLEEKLLQEQFEKFLWMLKYFVRTCPYCPL